MNSPEEFVPPREKVVERPSPPWGRFIYPRENDAGMFKACSSGKRVFSLRGKFTPLNDKIARKVKCTRKKVGERHVYPLIPMFPKGGLISSRYKMKFVKDNFTSPRGRFFSSKKKIADHFTSPRNLAGERHVSPTKPVFLRSRPCS